VQTERGTQVPVWFMRQAGRYHQHYQGIRKDHTFMQMCKTPELACEITMGPIRDFDFDAAILFSDLLYPLEQLNLGLSYDQGPPTLETHLSHLDQMPHFKVITEKKEYYNFQGEAVKLLRNELPDSKSLLGFVGSPFTLFTYAVEGSHKGSLVNTKKGLYDGRFQQFCQVLFPNLLESMRTQAANGSDAMCIFDTAAGELSIYDYEKFVVPEVLKIVDEFKKEFPQHKIIYYGKLTHINYIKLLNNSQIDVFGVDWRLNIAQVMKELNAKHYVQGNIDPCWLHLPWSDLKNNLDHYVSDLKSNEIDYSRWIFGLGHGVLVQTPEENVRSTVQYVHQNLIY
jgi:uroporphyrinogen decarboxylase